jgi:hypothetical protein
VQKGWSNPSRRRIKAQDADVTPTDCRDALAGASLEGLEPCEGKLSRTVLRGRGRVTACAYPVP